MTTKALVEFKFNNTDEPSCVFLNHDGQPETFLHNFECILRERLEQLTRLEMIQTTNLFEACDELLSHIHHLTYWNMLGRTRHNEMPTVDVMEQHAEYIYTVTVEGDQIVVAYTDENNEPSTWSIEFMLNSDRSVTVNVPYPKAETQLDDLDDLNYIIAQVRYELRKVEAIRDQKGSIAAMCELQGYMEQLGSAALHASMSHWLKEYEELELYKAGV